MRRAFTVRDPAAVEIGQQPRLSLQELHDGRRQLVALVVVGKMMVWTSVVLLFRHPLRTSLLVGMGLTQIGEFSYVLVQVGRQAGLVEDAVYNATLAASLLTILANSALMRVGPKLLDRWRIGTARAAPMTA